MVLSRRNPMLAGDSLFLWSACKRSGELNMQDVSHGALKLEVRREDGPGRITLHYATTNLTQRPLYLFNILHGEIGENGVFPLDDGGYVELADGAIIVSRKLFPVPELVFVESKNLPFVTRLAPGATFQEAIGLPLPLAPANPYESSNEGGDGAVEMLPLFFEIGYFLGVQGTELLGKRFATDRGPRMGFDVFTDSEQQLQRSGALGTAPIRGARG
jgi:hypothetical protein